MAAWPSVVCLDVGGISSSHGELDALALVRQISSMLGPALEAVVIKSQCVAATARALRPISQHGDGVVSRKAARRGGDDATTQAETAAQAAQAATAAQAAMAAPAAPAPMLEHGMLAINDAEQLGAAEASRASAAVRARAQRLPGSKPPTHDRLRTVLGARYDGVSVVLENVRPGNAALIARAAECLGIGRLHLVYGSEPGAATEETLRATRGFSGLEAAARVRRLSALSKRASEWLVLEQHASIEACAAHLREHEGTELIVATTPEGDGAISLYPGVTDGATVAMAAAASDDESGRPWTSAPSWASRRLALLFGCEASGLSRSALELSDVRLCVPQLGMTQSLNVASCAALVLGETLRQRRAQADAAQSLWVSDVERDKLERELLHVLDG